MRIEPLNREHMESVRLWRNSMLETLRTPYLLTEEMQQEYYRDVLCDRNSRTRYFAFYGGAKDSVFVGMGGIENIEWENRRGEISLIVKPEMRGKGYGAQIVSMILNQAFKHINLDHLWGECYYCGNTGFWRKILIRYSAFTVDIPARKYYNGVMYGSLYFNIDKDGRK